MAPDWSKQGTGFLLLQKYCDCPDDKAPTCCPDGWRLVFAGSRVCTSAESGYAPIEGEASAIAWSLDKCRMFVLCCQDLIVTTDHEPLKGIFESRDLSKVANPRLFRLKERTLRYRFRIQHQQGKWHHGSDAMSRNPASAVRAVIQVCLSPASSSDLSEADCVESYVRSSTVEAMAEYGDDLGAISPDMIRAAGRADQSYSPHWVTLLRQVSPGSAIFWTLRYGSFGKSVIACRLMMVWSLWITESLCHYLIASRFSVACILRTRALLGWKPGPTSLSTGLEWMLQFAISMQAVGLVLALPQVCHVSLWWWLHPQTILSSRLSWMCVRSNLICTWFVLTDWLDGLWFFIWSLVMPPPWSWSPSAGLCFRHMAHRKSWAVMEDPYSRLMHSRVSSRHGVCVIACLQLPILNPMAELNWPSSQPNGSSMATQILLVRWTQTKQHKRFCSTGTHQFRG